MYGNWQDYRGSALAHELLLPWKQTGLGLLDSKKCQENTMPRPLIRCFRYCHCQSPDLGSRRSSTLLRNLSPLISTKLEHTHRPASNRSPRPLLAGFPPLTHCLSRFPCLIPAASLATTFFAEEKPIHRPLPSLSLHLSGGPLRSQSLS